MPWIKGSELSPEQRERVLRAMVNRDTVESPWSSGARFAANRWNSDVPTDSDWLAHREFLFSNDGPLSIKARHTYAAARAATE
jgi:hypothetical protein